MGAFKPLLLLCILVSAASADTLKLQQPPRPTRTLGSLFGSKPTPIGPTPQQQQPEQQKVVPHHQQQQQSQVRPLVYQVKYYDRHTGNTIDQSDARNYGNIDKSGVVVDNTNINPYFISPQVQQQQQQQRVYYYNPLIDTQPAIPNNPVYYTLAQVGNSQVLVPCTQDQVVESTVALNVEQKPVVKETQQPQRIVPPATVSQPPLVREQVVAAAHELSALGSVPGSAIVGAGINSVPYGYYYYYYIPNDPQHIHQQQQVQQQQQPQQHRVVHHPSQIQQQQQIASTHQFQQYHNPYQQIPSIQQQLQYQQQFVNPVQNYLYRYQNQYPVVPVIVSGVPVLNHQHHVNQPVLPQVLPTPLVHKDVNKGVQQNIRQPVVKDNH